MWRTRPHPGLPRPIAVAGGLLIDRLVEEPASAQRAKALFGRLMALVEDRLGHDRRAAGWLYALIGTGIGIGGGAIIRSTTVATAVAVKPRALVEQAFLAERALRDDDLELARAVLSAMDGRNATGLSCDQMAGALVESVAENTVNVLVAPALFAVVFGAPGVFAQQAIHTLDSMAGHTATRSRDFAHPSARLNDLLAWLPTRIAVMLVVLVRPRRARVVLRQMAAHGWRNGGLIEEAFAAALGIHLSDLNGDGRPVVARPELHTRQASLSDIARARRLLEDVEIALGLSLVGCGVVARRGRRVRHGP
jgi:adenosylcobinamide-phosphate synthase